MSAAKPQVSAPEASRLTAQGDPVGFTAFWFALRFAFLLWLGDVVSVAIDRPGYPLPTTLGLAAALFVSLLVGGVVGGVAQIGLSLASSGQPARLSAQLYAYLFEGSARAHVPRLATVFALPWALLVFGVGSVLISQRLIVAMARPEFAALALAGAHLVLLVVLAAVFLAARGAALGIGQVLVTDSSRLRVWQLALALALAGLLALGAFGFVYREPLSYLPWRSILQVLAALILSVLLGLLPGLPRVLDWGLRCAGVLVVLATAVAAASLSASTGFARRVAEQSSLAGHLAFAVLRPVFDRDHDGYLSILGGGDCAPVDPARNPGATDIPGNGVDEDCDGRDLNPSALLPRGRFDFAVPDTVPRRPPVVLITIDAFAADRLAALGGKRGVTSQLDKLITRSAFFDSCYAQGPSTRLSFPSMFTSRWDTQIKQQLIGKHPFPIDPSEKLLAEMLKSAGYETSVILGDGYFAPRRWNGITRGFDRVVDSAITVTPRPPHNGPNVTDAAIAELARPHERPLFMWAHYYDAHSPHVQPKDSPVYGTQRADVYDAELWLVDREVGRLLAAIDSTFGGKALVVITADHGIAFDKPRHEKFNYGYDLYSSVLHVPLIVHAPFVSPRKIAGPVTTMDVLPTLLNLLRVKSAPTLEGTSLVPELLRGERSRPPQLMHQMFLEERLWKSEEPLERVSLRTDRFNLLYDRKNGFYELYDYRRDYFEQRDLTLDPAFEDQLLDLKRQLALLVYIGRRPEPSPAPSAAGSASARGKSNPKPAPAPATPPVREPSEP